MKVSIQAISKEYNFQVGNIFFLKIKQIARNLQLNVRYEKKNFYGFLIEKLIENFRHFDEFRLNLNFKCA